MLKKIGLQEAKMVNASHFDQWKVLAIHGKIDSFLFKKVVEDFQTQLEDGAKWIAVEMSNAEFLSVAMIRYLSQLADRMRQRGGDVVIIGAQDSLRKNIDTFAGRMRLKMYGDLLDLRYRVAPEGRAEYEPHPELKL
jgi:anti-anti-sigma regulatory factor